ncbi:hypothetical protein GCM10027456_33760 [Kineosporia babensis]
MGGQPDLGKGVIGALPELRRLLLDLGRCPGCAVVLAGPRCSSCGIDLGGPEGARVAMLSRAAADALNQRELTLNHLRAQVPTAFQTQNAPAAQAPTEADQAAPMLVTQAPATENPAAQTPTTLDQAAQTHDSAAQAPATLAPATPAPESPAGQAPVAITSATQAAPPLDPAPQTAGPIAPVVQGPAAQGPATQRPLPHGPAMQGSGAQTSAGPGWGPGHPGPAQHPGQQQPGWSAPPPPPILSPRNTGPNGPAGPNQPPWPGRTPDRSAPAWLSVNTVLVGIGALLLAAAAIGFLIFSWQSMPLAARAAVIGGITLAAVGIATWLRPRLPETAEAVGALAVVLILGDAWAIRNTGLFGADRPDGMLYAGGAMIVTGLLVEIWGRVSRIRAATHAGAGLIPVGVFYLAFALLRDSDPVIGAYPIAMLLAAAVTLSRRTLPQNCRTERILSRTLAALFLANAAFPAALGFPDVYGATLGALLVTLLLAAQTWADAPRSAAGQNTASQSPADHGTAAQEALSHPHSPALPSHLNQPGQPQPGHSQQFNQHGPPNPQSGWPQGPQQGGPARPTPARPRNPLTLNRNWSVATGVAAAGTTVLAGSALAESFDIAGFVTLIPITVLPGLLLLAVSFLKPEPTANLRRTALALGVLATSSLVALPTIGLALWQVVRPIPPEIRSSSFTTRFGDLGQTDPSLTELWFTSLASLALITAVVWAIGRHERWPNGPWPQRIHRPLNRIPLPATASLVVLLALTPVIPVVATIAALLVLSLAAVVLALRSHRHRQLLWIAGSLVGLLGVTLAWATEELPGVVTVLAVLALLAARRQIDAPDENSRFVRAGLALLAAGLIPAALLVLFDQIKVDQWTSLVTTALICGLGSAALFAVPRLPLPQRPGRAEWSPIDRFTAAVPGIVMLVISYLSALSGTHEVPVWTEPAIVLVALVIALAGALLLRPAMATAFPEMPLVLAGLTTPLFGALVMTNADAWDFTAVSAGLLWSLSTAVGTVALTVAMLNGAAETSPWKDRRLGAEIGLVATGVVALAVTSSADADSERMWLTLLILGAAASAIALTPERSRVGWLAGVLLTGSSWLRLADSGVQVVEAYTVPPAAVLLAITYYASRRAPAQAQAQPKKATDPISQSYLDLGVLARPLLMVIIPSVIASALSTSVIRPIVLMIAGAAAVLVSRYFLRERPGPAQALTLVGLFATIGAGLLRTVFNLNEFGPLNGDRVPLTTVEAWTAPGALLLLVFGLQLFQRLERDRPTPDFPNSWTTLGPGLALLLGPSILVHFSELESTLARPVLIMVAAALALAAGAVRRMQAPFVIGAVVLTMVALVLTGPWLRDVGASIPLWVWAAVIGLALLLLGAGYERRLAQLRTVRSRLVAMR